MISTVFDNFTAPPSSKLLGWHLLDARPSDGWIRIGFDGKRDFCNPAGFVQGGILSAMLDDTMGPAVFAMTEGKLYTATITMTVNFLVPAKPGPITGEAKVTQLGKTVAFVEGRLMAEDSTVLAMATTSARLVETAKAIAAPASSRPAALPA
ncbi:PaaI family thioesterase [Bradyrhizobium australiense]|uniref:PaaI family thioesterase n=1 Tax=Bradyrhizobium australiense TaxID=2721161 RepID=A0A7Y4GM63_9BRAD|nr:PaaI family thioesterase [Bradyrhizobium australiense]NOJ38271.1 PaaI family thioesterase [Bradyrhizobium australiense]